MKRNRLITLSILSGVLLALPWQQYFSGIILLVAFIPLLFVEDYLFINKEKNRPYLALGYAFLSFLVWNGIATFWIGKVSLFGALIVILANAFLWSLIFFLYHLTKRNLGRNFGTFSLLVLWLGWEYVFMNTEITWPWLNLGNGFAKDISLIQWYEFTGVLGGSLWVLTINLVVFGMLKFYIVHKSFKAQLDRIIFLFILLFLPITISLIAFNSYKTKGDPVKVGILQPNIDPYQEKFSGLSHYQQMQIMTNLADSIADARMDYLVGPETALGKVNLKKLNEEMMVQEFQKLVNKLPNIHLIIGIDAYKNYDVNEEKTPTSRQRPDNKQFYDIFNSAVQVDTSRKLPVYHKSKLVTGVEKMPYSRFFRFMEQFVINLGGTSGTRAIQESRETFQHTSKNIQVAPVICYESVFGEYVTKYIQQGASLIFIITNDGWLRSPGYQQHLHFARLRAIETRRSIARSANTGISGFINQKGQLLKATEWWEKKAIKGTLYANNEKTFYVKYGDFVGRISAFLAVFVLLYLIAKMLMKRTKHADMLLRLRE